MLYSLSVNCQDMYAYMQCCLCRHFVIVSSRVDKYKRVGHNIQIVQ